MDVDSIVNRLLAYVNEASLLRDEPLKNHTTFRIGGPCDLMIVPKTQQQIVDTVQTLRACNAPFVILGNGSNVLVHDNGIRGCVIKLTNTGEEVVVDRANARLYAGAGETMMALANRCAREGLAGLESASGIPGTLGGAVYMNAGAYGQEMKDVVYAVRVLTCEGVVQEISHEQMCFGYRTSAAQQNGWMILGATLQLTPDDPAAIAARIADFTRRRRDKQPLMYASAGSTFKRPQGHFAAKLIDDAGLKGAHVGDAEVSTMHAGFIVNKGHASYADVMALMELVERTVMEKFGVKLRPEVRLLGETL